MDTRETLDSKKAEDEEESADTKLLENIKREGRGSLVVLSKEECLRIAQCLILSDTRSKRRTQEYAEITRKLDALLDCSNDFVADMEALLTESEKDVLKSDMSQLCHIVLDHCLEVYGNGKHSSKLDLKTCQCCCQETIVEVRPCCTGEMCRKCLGQWVRCQLSEMKVQMRCPHCTKHLTDWEVRRFLAREEDKKRYNQLLTDRNRNPDSKTCPGCNRVEQRCRRKLRECPECHLVWCFPCHSPEHQPLTCRQFRSNEKKLEMWSRGFNNDQRKARRCPRCTAMIEKNGGCNELTCTNCRISFCYLCGQRMRGRAFAGIPWQDAFFGGHDSTCSIFGCHQLLFQGKRRHVRRMLRGSFLALKIALMVPVGVISLPVLIPVGLYKYRHKLRRGSNE